MSGIYFVTKVRTKAGKQAARLLIASIRAFGGELSGCPVWLFEVDPHGTPCHGFENEAVRVIPLKVPESLLRYDFGDDDIEIREPLRSWLQSLAFKENTNART